MPFTHASTLCGWLFPGPKSIAPAPPRLTAIAPAVRAFPYSFVWLDAAAANVFFAVALDGFTPMPTDARPCTFAWARTAALLFAWACE